MRGCACASARFVASTGRRRRQVLHERVDGKADKADLAHLAAHVNQLNSHGARHPSRAASPALSHGSSKGLRPPSPLPNSKCILCGDLSDKAATTSARPPARCRHILTHARARTHTHAHTRARAPPPPPHSLHFRCLPPSPKPSRSVPVVPKPATCVYRRLASAHQGGSRSALYAARR